MSDGIHKSDELGTFTVSPLENGRFRVNLSGEFPGWVVTELARAIAASELTERTHSDGPLFERSVSRIGLSARAVNALKEAGVHNVRKLTAMTEEDLCYIRNLGKISKREVIDALRHIGLSLREATEANE